MDTTSEQLTEQQNMAKRISIAQEFNEFPAGRIPDDGPNSGQRFRDDFLAPALKDAIKNNYKLEIDLDGTMGYGSSFLDEAFGGLIREHHLGKDEILAHIKILDSRVIYEKLAIKYILEEQSRSNKK
jgi:hypothetical protein